MSFEYLVDPEKGPQWKGAGARRELIPTHVHSGTHETFHILEGNSASSSKTPRAPRPRSCSPQAISPSCRPGRRTPIAWRRPHA